MSKQSKIKAQKKSKSQALQAAPSFTVTSVYTFEEFLKFSKFSTKKRLFACDIIVLLTYVAIAIISAIQGNILAIPAYLIIVPVMMFFSRVFLKFAIKRIWKSSPEAQNLETTFTFRVNDFRQKNKLGDNYFKYNELLRIDETDDNFYLMLAKNQGSIITKKDCDQETIEFLRRRAKECAVKHAA